MHSWRPSVTYRCTEWTLRPILRVLTNARWSGGEHLPRHTGFVVCPNHIGPFDPLCVAHYLVNHHTKPYFLGKESLFRIPVVGLLLRNSQQIPVYRSTANAVQAYRDAVSAVKRGQCVVIYPEGTVTRDPDLWPMKGRTGAARVALETRCPVVPVAVWGAQDVVPYRSGVMGAVAGLARRHHVQVKAGPSVDLTDLYDKPMDAAVLAEATDRIVRAMRVQVGLLRGEEPPARVWDPRSVNQTPPPPDASPHDRDE